MPNLVSTLIEWDQRQSQSLTLKLACLVIAVAGAILWWLNPADIPLHSPDSTSYIRFDDYRGAAYPALLDILQWLTGSLDAIVVVQLGLVVLCAWFLCLRFAHSFESAIGAIVFLLVVVGNPFFMRYNFSILTEAMFFSVLMLYVGLALNRSDTPGSLSLIGMGLLLALLILIKPVAWSFISIPVLLIIQQALAGKPWVKPAMLIVSGFLLVTAAGAQYRFQVHGEYAPGSFLGNQLVGKLVFASFEPEQTTYPTAAEKWQEWMHLPSDIRQKHFHDIDERFLYSLNIYDFIRFVKAPELAQLAGDDQRLVQGQLAMDILRQDPLEALSDVGLQLYGLWTLATLQGTSVVESYMDKATRFQSQMPEGIQLYAIHGRIGPVVLTLKGLFYALFAVTLITMLIALWNWIRRRAVGPSLAMLFYLSAAVHSYFLLVALFQAALPRYLFAMWPMLVLIAIATVLVLVRKAFTSASQY